MCSILFSLLLEIPFFVFGCGYNVNDSVFDKGNSDSFNTDVLNVMSYHRNKMNEYLCNNYIASEIAGSFQAQSRENVNNEREQSIINSRLARESLLKDLGSQKYKDWLSRSTTLEDIYRQFEHLDVEHTPPHDTLSHETEGEVTGYALVGHKHHQASKPIDYGPGDGHYVSTGLGSHSYYHDDDYEDEHEEKGMKLKELFHFALTAIAFLAFATFMIEVIMCLMEVPAPVEPDYILMPTNTGTGQASKLETDIPEVNRQKRSFVQGTIPIEVLNVMSSRVLSSIEALTILHEDDGQCLRRVLCQNSKYSKSLPGMKKIWLPVWSIGISWIGGNLSSTNSSKITNILEILKSATMGLGKKECHIMYPKCNIQLRREKRKVGKFY